MLLGRSLKTCHCLLFYLNYFIICITFICVLAEDRVLYIMHQNRMPTGPLVLHTGNFLGFFQGCGVLTVLYYKMVLKWITRKSTYTAESMEEVLKLMKDEGLSVYKVSKQYHIWWNTLKGYTQEYPEHPNCKYCKVVGGASIYHEVTCRLWFNS